MALHKILVVDDSAPFRRVVIAMLKGTVRAFAECGTGTEALRLFAQEKPDCVLMDLEMQPMDGMTATRQLMQKHPEAKVIILSQHNDPELQQEAKSHGAIGFVAKDHLPTLVPLLQNITSITS